MFKIIAQYYVEQYSFLNLFNFITFRVGASILTALFFSLIFGQYLINKISKIQPIGQPIRNDGPENSYNSKSRNSYNGRAPDYFKCCDFFNLVV